MSGIVEPSTSDKQQQQQQQQQQKTPSRSKLVQRLLDASSSFPAFIKDLLTTQAVIVAGTEAAAFVIERQGDQLALRAIEHIRPDESDQSTRQAALRAFQNIIQPCAEQAKDGAIEVGSPDGGDSQYCLVTVLRHDGEVVAATGVITRARDMDRAKQRLTSMQLVAGYFELFSLRRNSEQAKVLAERHQHVLQYAGAVGMAEGFEAAAMNLCNELANRTGASRVSLGWLKGRHIKVRALSHTEKFDKKQELIVQIQKTMEECLDQEEPVRFDPDGNSTANVTRAAKELSRTQGNNIVWSVPLRRREEIVGVLTVELPQRHVIDPNMDSGLTVAAELLAPQLYDRYENDRFIVVKMGHSIRNLAKLAVGPRHMGVKLLILGVVALGLFVTFYRPMYRVRAPFQIVAEEPRSICAPYDGQLEEVFVKPGQTRVPKGTVLAKMRTNELDLRLAKAQAEIQTRTAEAKQYAGEGKIAERDVALKQRDEAEKTLKLLQYEREMADIKAPFDCIVLRGSLGDRRGAPMKEGDVLFEIAQVDPDPSRQNQIDIEAELMVPDRDIQAVKEAFEKKDGKRRDKDGQLSASSFAHLEHDFVIKRIVPVGEPKEGENVFKIYVEVKEPQPWMQPGIAGEARVDIDSRSLFWIWTHRPVEWLNLKAWSWLGI